MAGHKQNLLAKIRSRKIVIGVIGLGYVGLPLAVEKAMAGYSVIGIDSNKDRIKDITNGKSYIDDVPPEDVCSVVRSGSLVARTDYDSIPDMDVIIICLPTPLTKNLTPDLSFIEKSVSMIAKKMKAEQLISLESTTYPGTTKDVILPLLKRSKLVPEKDFFLAYSPERIDPGNSVYNTKNTTRVLGAIGPNSLEVAQAFYQQSIRNLAVVPDTETAELAKVFENTFRMVNIALVNELSMFCNRIGVNVWEVLEATFTKPFGIIPFWPGPGVGGHCIPLDPHYLEWKAREYGFNTRFIALASEVNRMMPEFVFQRIEHILNRKGKSVSGSKILIVGVAYKPDVSDIRESPAIQIIDKALREGAQVYYHDPLLPELQDLGLRSSSLSPEFLKEMDIVVITTNHSSVDYSSLVSDAPFVFDTRNATKRVMSNREKIELL